MKRYPEIGLPPEAAYAFRERVSRAHLPGRRRGAAPEGAQVAIADGWRLCVSPTADALTVRAADDLRDYLAVSMAVSVVMARDGSVPRHGLRLAAPGAQGPSFAAPPPGAGYRLRAAADGVALDAASARMLAQGSYAIEDRMNLAAWPALPLGEQVREPLFPTRMIHSGWGIDAFPDGHLNVLAHAGMTAIVVFAAGVNLTPTGPCDFRDLVRRAAAYGLDVYFYSYLKSLWHPDAPEAEDAYRRTYGALFEACPEARGVVLVGESCEFPSHDPRTCGRRFGEPPPDGLPDHRPYPGWWPCTDFPAWLRLMSRVIRRPAPEADIVFWSYNWGWAPEAERLRLVREIPDDISLQVTFEMFEPLPRDGIRHLACDYTIASPGPGRYFVSEAQAACRRGLKLYTMCNTGGATWDFGVAPYVPTPDRWARRHAALREARERWGLCGLMESHHFGFYPSVVADQAKAAYWSPVAPAQAVLADLARRELGARGAAAARDAWRCWSDAMEDYPPTNEDQYGPFRVGPSFPLHFPAACTRTFDAAAPRIPSDPHAHFGSRIVLTDYRPLELEGQSPAGRRWPVEMAMLTAMLQRWEAGNEHMARAMAEAGAAATDAARRQWNLGCFLACMIRTTLHVKQWWLLTQRLWLASDAVAAGRILDALAALGEAEIANAEAAIPLVAADSRLGWEPSMEYMTDATRIRWKIRQVRQLIDQAIPAYRALVTLPCE